MTIGGNRRGVRITVLLIIAVGALVTLSTGIVLVLSGGAAFRSTFELLQASAELIIERLEDDVRGHVAPAAGIAGALSDLVAGGHVDPAEQTQMIVAMKGAMAGHPQIAGLLFWRPDGSQIRILRTAQGGIKTSTQTRTPDADQRRAFEQVALRRAPTWRAPTFTGTTTFVNVAAPIYDGDQLLGIIATGVTIAELSSFVDSIGRRLGLTAFILYGEAHVLAHPALKDVDPSQIYSRSRPLVPIADFDDAVLKLFQSTAPSTSHDVENAVVRRIEIDGKRHLAMSRQLDGLGETPWLVGVYAPLESLDDQVRRLVGAMAAGLGVLAIAILCAVLLARYIARPIRRIAAVAEHVGRMELGRIEPLEHSRISELDEQAVAFNRMLDGLRWFETYVPKSLVDRLIADASDGSVPSGEREVTVMFTDIIGFTAMTENMSPADVAAMLNAHFEALAACIEEENGTLDKYIGDAVMAFWGAPDDQPDHAARACRAALSMADAVSGAAPDGISHPPIRLKIALHTGRLLVGNIGAKRRMNYTVIGDTVNTCSRIEALCARFDHGEGCVILASGDTVSRAAGQGFAFEDVGAFEVKGRSRPVSVCRLAGSG